MASESSRSELLKEYEKVVDILQSYDSYFLTIKNWSVTVSGTALAVGVGKGTSDIFRLAATLAASFWATEVRFKLLQLGHTQRAGELERALQAGTSIPSPRILTSFGEQSALNNASRRWKKVLSWPQVMLPHV